VMWTICEKASEFDFNIFKLEALLGVYKSQLNWNETLV